MGFGMRLVGFCDRVIGCGTSSLNGSLLSKSSWLQTFFDSFCLIAS